LSATESRTIDRVLAAIACTLLLCLLSFAARQTWLASPRYDDSGNATVAKNVAFGLGYKTAYHVDKPFNHVVTTGPALLLPAAAVIAVFGNAYWTPSATTVVMTSCLLLALVVLSGRLFERRADRWLFVSLMLFFFVMFTTETFTGGDPGFLKFWHQLLGEMPAALWISVAALLLSALRPGVVPFLLAGVCCSLAVLTKVIAVFGVVPLFGLSLALLYRDSAASMTRKTLLVAVMLGAFLLPIGAFEFVKKASVSAPAYAAMKKNERRYLQAHGSGIKELRRAPSKLELLRATLTRNIGILIQYFGSGLQAVMFGAVILVSAWGLRAGRLSRGALAGLALLSGFGIHLAWWALLSPTGWTTHLMMGLVYAFVGVSLLVASVASWPIRLCALALVLLVTGGRLADFHHFVPRSFEREPRLVALLETRDFIERELVGKGTLMGCGWAANRDLELVLSASGNFKDCLLLDPAGTDRRFLVRVDPYWNRSNDPDLALFGQDCDRHTIFRRPPYSISECRWPGPVREVET
jgi:hypothetical protein